MRLTIALCLGLAAPAAAQAPRFGMEGNLEPTQDLGCIALSDVMPDQTAADLALAARTCLADTDFDRAVEMFVAMQVHGVFDAHRVADVSAHQAVVVLGQDIAQSIAPDQDGAFQAAVGRFDPDGRDAACIHFRTIGPPDYHPVYMIQYGTMAFMRPEEPPLVDAFDPEDAWDGVLENFLNCPRQEN